MLESVIVPFKENKLKGDILAPIVSIYSFFVFCDVESKNDWNWFTDCPCGIRYVFVRDNSFFSFFQLLRQMFHHNWFLFQEKLFF